MKVKSKVNYGPIKVGDIFNAERSVNGVDFYHTPPLGDYDVFRSDEVEILPDDPTPSTAGGPPGATRVASEQLPTADQPVYGHPMFYILLRQMAALHSRKNHDYAGAEDPLRNLKSSARLGLDPVTGVLVRLQDKMSRLESFAQQGELLVKDESVEDTLMDMAVYSILGIILRREAKANAS